ncbi:MAG TPA: hypothetical protein VMY18_10505, partial [Acidobacteriota bacterium]|nr:hypothetical protein [Acidobacteriota bacterium]
MEYRETTRPNQPESRAEGLLESWKEIASYLQRDVRTAIRWEKGEGLPIHRHLHKSGSSVYAFRSELDAWRANRNPTSDQIVNGNSLWPRTLRIAFGSVGLALLLFTTGNGGRAHLAESSPLPADGSGIATKEIWTDAMDGIFGSPSPDGQHLSFLDWNSLNLGIWDIEHEKQRLMTTEGTWDEPRQMAYTSIWSPDGDHLAYQWVIVREGNQENELRVVGLEDPSPRVLVQGLDADWLEPLNWSPDGEQILVALNTKFGDSKLALAAFKSGSLDIVRTKDHPVETGSFSPDGRHVAYSTSPGPETLNKDLFLYSLESRAESRLVEHPANDELLGWVPESEWILFASDRAGSRGLWAVKVVDGEREGDPQLLKGAFARTHPLGFSVDGSFYYSEVKVARDIIAVEIDPETGEVVREPEKAVVSFEGSNLMPSYSPDGKYLAYVSKRAGMFFPTLRGNALCVKPVGAEEEHVFLNEFLKHQIEFVAGPQWYPGSRQVMIAGFGKRTGFYTVDIESGSIERVLAFENDRPVGHLLSPDGETLFYVRRSGNRTMIIRRNLLSGEEYDLHRISGNDSLTISLSLDGLWLAFCNRGKEKTLQVMPSTGGEARVIHTFKPEGYSVSHAWSPDGKYIFFECNQNVNERSLCRVSVQAGTNQELIPGIQSLSAITVHPDGRHIAFHSASEIDTATDV